MNPPEHFSNTQKNSANTMTLIDNLIFNFSFLIIEIWSKSKKKVVTMKKSFFGKNSIKDSIVSENTVKYFGILSLSKWSNASFVPDAFHAKNACRNYSKKQILWQRKDGRFFLVFLSQRTSDMFKSHAFEYFFQILLTKKLLKITFFEHGIFFEGKKVLLLYQMLFIEKMEDFF